MGPSSFKADSSMDVYGLVPVSFLKHLCLCSAIVLGEQMIEAQSLPPNAICSFI